VPVHYAGSSSAEIAASVETAVRAGTLPAGAGLPTVRALATDLGVSPATVANAYRSLRQRGLIETAGRNGTRVRFRPPVAPRASHRLPVPAGVRDLASGAPDLRLLPKLDAALRAIDPVPCGYETAGPLPDLVDLARDRLRADGVDAPAITIASGALDATERVLAAHLAPGDRVAVEDPGWANLLDLVAAAGLYPVPVPVDDEGPTPAGLGAALDAGVRAFVLTSRAQNPTGAAISPARAAALRALLAEHPDLLVVEDDHAAELSSEPLAPVAGTTRRWAFVRSVSKPYGPDLRVAVLAGDEATVARVEGRLRLGAGWVSTILQRLVVALWRDPSTADQVRTARDSYRRRREALLAALADRGVAVSGRTGINLWIPVPDEVAAVARLRDAGWAVAPGTLYRIEAPPAIRVTVSQMAETDLVPFADAIAAVLGPAHPRYSA